MIYLPGDPMLFQCKVCGYVGEERHVHRHDIDDPETDYINDERAGTWATAVWVYRRRTMNHAAKTRREQT